MSLKDLVKICLCAGLIAIFATKINAEEPASSNVESSTEVTAPEAPASPQSLNTPRESPYLEATLQGLDKATGRISTLKAPINSPIKFGTLTITARYCYKASPEDPPESAAFLEIDDQQPNEKPKNIFTGWMFASSPAISAIDHVIYDISVSGCKNPRRSEMPAPAVTETPKSADDQKE